ERTHRPDDSDLDFCRRRGFFRMPIPKDLGGEGSPKAEYYLLTTNIHRLADGAVSLTVQVNSSLGTTPVLLARDKDLPKAQKDIPQFAGGATLQNEIRDRLQMLQGLFAGADAKAIAQEYGDLHKRLEESVLSRPVLRVQAHRFVQFWQEAGRLGKTYDLPAMR